MKGGYFTCWNYNYNMKMCGWMGLKNGFRYEIKGFFKEGGKRTEFHWNEWKK
jgi:hypothetical protein